MHISALQIHGFGHLSDVLLEGLSPGLNVIYGPNGCGKSTLLKFLRGVLLGFDESRQFGLLPPKDWSPAVRRQAGGSFSLMDGPRRVGIVRIAGRDRADHLGVRVEGARDTEAREYRQRLAQLHPDFVNLFVAVGTSEAHSIDAMLQLAARDGLELSPTVSESPAHQARLNEIRRRREQLLGSPDDAAQDTAATLAQLDRQRKRMAESLEAARQQVIARFRELLDREQDLTSLLESVSREVEECDIELQACQSDLRATEDELWTARTELLSLAITRHMDVLSDSSEVADVDERVSRTRQMLRDLAQTRHQLSCDIADRIVQAAPHQVNEHDASDVECLREDRDQLDRCEHEVAEYLRRLMARRVAVAPNVATTASTVVPMAESLQRERIDALAARLDSLHEELRARFERHQQACARWCSAAERRRRIRIERLALAADDGLDVLRFQLESLEQEWHRIHDDWQALTLAEAALTRAQSAERIETPAALVADASRLFKRLTQGRYLELRYLIESDSLVAVNSHLETRDLSLLSRGTLDQAALSLRLAMLAAYADRGVRWPLVLDEVLVDSDLDRLRLAALLMHEFTLNSRQIIYLTCLEHLVDVMRSVGAQILYMPGFEPSAHGTASSLLTGPHWLSAREEAKSPVSRQLLVSQSIAAESDASVTVSEAMPVIPQSSPRQPSDGYWLRHDSPLSLVSSISPQMASGLASRGIHNVTDLLTVNVQSTDVVDKDTPFTAAQLRIWQAEAVLLYRVPKLTGRDAQLLVSAGILSAEQLAAETPETLMRRLDRLRGSSLDDGTLPGWPRHSDLKHWIANARVARPSIQATEQSQERVHQPIKVEETSNADTQSGDDANPAELRFFLDLTSPVVDAPSIGPTTARKLSRLGVHTVGDLLNRDAVVIADRLGDRRISSATVLLWQQQANLMVRVPELRGHDVQVLVACGIIDPESLARYRAEDLFEKIGPFVATNEGQRLLRSARTPDLHEVTAWIHWARQARAVRAA